MIRDTPINKSGETLHGNEELSLPSFADGLQSALSTGKSLNVDGTNVIRVPFGIRQPRRQRPDKPQSWPTLVLPFQPVDSPTPPPQAA